MPYRRSPEWHYHEAERLLASVTRFTGLPLEAVEVEVKPHHEAICREALIHATLATARPPADTPGRRPVNVELAGVVGLMLVVALVALLVWVI